MIRIEERSPLADAASFVASNGPFSIFCWVTRFPRIPVNARILVSRNKREGGYCGRTKLGLWSSAGDQTGPSGHWRAGVGPTHGISLRDWSRL